MHQKGQKSREIYRDWWMNKRRVGRMHRKYGGESDGFLWFQFYVNWHKVAPSKGTFTIPEQCRCEHNGLSAFCWHLRGAFWACLTTHTDVWWENYQFLHTGKKMNGLNFVPPFCIFSRAQWGISFSVGSFCQEYEETWSFDLPSAHPGELSLLISICRI